MLVYGGVEERKDRVGILARTNKTGTGTKGVLRVFNYYGLPIPKLYFSSYRRA